MTIVTFFVDIGRGEFSSLGRTTESYFEDFLSGIAQIECDIVLFIDASSKIALEAHLSRFPTPAKIRLETINFEDFPFANNAARISEVLAGPAMKFFSLRDSLVSWRHLPLFVLRSWLIRGRGKRNLIWDELPISGTRAPEYSKWRYLIATWAKPWVMREAYVREIVNKSQKIVFADFGLGHSTKEFCGFVQNSKLNLEAVAPGKITLSQRGDVQLRTPSPWAMAQLIDDALIPAGVIGADWESCQLLANFFQDETARWMELEIVPDDQVLLTMFYQKFPELVKLLPRSASVDGYYQIQPLLLKKMESQS